MADRDLTDEEVRELFRIATEDVYGAHSQRCATLVLRLLAERKRLLADVRRARSLIQAGNCFEHANNCCAQWCQGCIAGARVQDDISEWLAATAYAEGSDDEDA